MTKFLQANDLPPSVIDNRNFDALMETIAYLHLLRFMVYSVEGVFFLGFVDASYALDHANLLAELIEQWIEDTGKDKVVQVVTDNSHNLKAACTILMDKIPTLLWTPFKKYIQQAKRVTTFIYKHARFMLAMCEKMGEKDPVVPATTRYSTSFLTLERIYKHRDVMKSNLSVTQEGKNVRQIVLCTTFWNGVEDCMKASEPLLVLLRMVFAGLDLAKKKIRESFASNRGILEKVMDIVEQRWADQMEQKLYGATLFLNPNKFCDIKENDCAHASSLRKMFNDQLEGSKFEPLVLEGYEFEHEWVGIQAARLYNRDKLAWQLVEEVTGGSYTLEDHYRPRIDSGHGKVSGRPSGNEAPLGDPYASDADFWN
uniref:DUF659 domain-containing protein n=1 Tax=Setaria italica TaxID=4555 RepID=K4AJ85_SETIT